jgi:hypothetical protein
MSFQVQLAENGHANDFPFQNYTGTDIPANTLVALDTNNLFGPTNVNDGIGVMLPGAAGAKVLGITLTVIKAGAAGAGFGDMAGRVRCFGPIAVAIATGAITGGSLVEADNATPGNVKVYAGPAYQAGIALSSSGATGDQIFVMLDGANNA